jgi:hypothetical protein
VLRDFREWVLQPVDRALFDPERLPDGAVAVVALAPTVVAGLVLFQVRAAIILGMALGAGVAGHALLAVLRARLEAMPVTAALIGVALLGPAAPLSWVAVAAALAVLLELLRARLLPVAGIQVGLIAYGAVYMVSAGAVAAYVNPSSGAALADPVHLWLQYGTGSAVATIDPVRLYVGNVPGPVFATSLLAVAVGTAWAWYARRVSLEVLLGFAAGAMVPIVARRWPIDVSLDSGPLWLLGGLVLAQREAAPSSQVGRAVLGVAGGLAALGVRELQMGIEGAAMALAGLQMVCFIARVVAWVAFRDRRPRPRPSLPPAGGTPRLPAPPRHALPAPQSGRPR